MDEHERRYNAEAGRMMRKQFIKDISAVIEGTPSPKHPDLPHGFTKAEQAETLRKMADQIEREAAGDPVKRSQARIYERDGWPNRQFFQKTPATPSPDMAERWKQENFDRRATAEKAERQSRADYWAARGREKAAEHQPMKHFRRNQERDR